MARAYPVRACLGNMATRHPIVCPADPGGSATAVVYDSGSIPQNVGSAMRATNANRVRTAVYTNVADAVFLVQWAAPGSSNLRTVSSETIPANTYFQRDALLQPGRTKISIVTTTDPTTWEVGAELVNDQGLAQ